MAPLSLLHLPAELQLLICQALCSHCGEKTAGGSRAAASSWQDGDEDIAGRRALWALCLTSKHFYAVSLPFLFHQFCLSGDQKGNKVIGGVGIGGSSSSSSSSSSSACAHADSTPSPASFLSDSVRRLTSFASVVSSTPRLASMVEKMHVDMNVLFRFKHDKGVRLAVALCSGLFGAPPSAEALEALRQASECMQVKADDGRELETRAMARLFLGMLPRLECLTLHSVYPWWWLWWSLQFNHVTLALPASSFSASSQHATESQCLRSEDGADTTMVDSPGHAQVGDDDALDASSVQAQAQAQAQSQQSFDMHLCRALAAPLSLPRLRRLHIQYGLLDGRALGAILSACPGLEVFSYIAGWPKSEEPDLNCAPQQVDHFQFGQACQELGRLVGPTLREVVLDIRQVLMPLAFFGVDEFPDATRRGFRDHFPGLRSLTLGIESVYASRYWESWDGDDNNNNSNNNSGPAADDRQGEGEGEGGEEEEEDTVLADMLPPSIESLQLLAITTARGAEFLPRLASGLRAVAAAKAAGQLPRLERVSCASLEPAELVDKIRNTFSECDVRFEFLS